MLLNCRSSKDYLGLLRHLVGVGRSKSRQVAVRWVIPDRYSAGFMLDAYGCEVSFLVAGTWGGYSLEVRGGLGMHSAALAPQ